MEMLRSFLCPNCDELCKVYNGDYLFTYNIECLQGHKQSNLEQEYLLKKERQNKIHINVRIIAKKIKFIVIHVMKIYAYYAIRICIKNTNMNI